MHTCRAPIRRWVSLAPPARGHLLGGCGARRVPRPRSLALRASSSSDSAPPYSPVQQGGELTVKQLQQQMADAVAAEDFATAAAIRDRLQSLDVPQSEDVLRLQLSAAIAEERFAVRPRELTAECCCAYLTAAPTERQRAVCECKQLSP